MLVPLLSDLHEAEIVAREAVLSGLIVTRTVLTRASAAALCTNAVSIALAGRTARFRQFTEFGERRGVGAVVRILCW